MLRYSDNRVVHPIDQTALHPSIIPEPGKSLSHSHTLPPIVQYSDGPTVKKKIGKFETLVKTLINIHIKTKYGMEGIHVPDT